ncbi:MAG: aspartate aminotransferase family protein [Gemmatimonadales bacterium]|nr:aspartate aminotransferase family protein [Gemmatimonadales bacterium]
MPKDTRIFHRAPSASLPVAVRGEGAYLYDADGRQYLDASGGAAISIIGHGHPAVIAAIREQAGALAFAHTSFFTSAPSEALAVSLIEGAPPGLSHVYFLSGGSEATEAALKLARQYHVAAGEPERTVFIHRRQSYHGNTIGALSVSGNPKRRAPYEPILPAATAIAPCYAYRHQRAGESVEAYAERSAAELEAEIVRAGPGRVAAFIAEPVVGATLGAVAAVPGYFERIQATCRRHGVLLIADEVMCGMGRTGTRFASTGFGIEPDLVTVAKGLAGGYQPLGALIVHRRVYERVTAERGAFVHGHTYSGHPTACAAGLAVQRVLQEERLVERVPALGAQVVAALTDAIGAHPHVGDIRGRGLLLGIELVESRDTRRPFPAARGVAQAIKKAGMEEGLICYPGSGTADGVDGDHILLAPPYTWTGREVGELADKLGRSLRRVLGG